MLAADSLAPAAGSVGIVLPGLARALGMAGLAAIESEGGSGEGESALTQADAVHLFGWSGATKAVARRARAMNKPFVVSPLGDAIEGPYRRRGWGERLAGTFGGDRLLRAAAAVYGINETEVEALRAQRVHANVNLLPIGLDTDEYTARGAAPSAGPRTILTLGSIHPIEGLVPLLKSFAELGAPAADWNIVIAGPTVGDWRMQIEAGVRRKGGADRVRFERAGDAAAQRALLAEASLVVAAALHVRPYVSVMQAAACGVPVMATTPVAPPGLGDAIRVCGPKREEIAVALREMITASDEERTTRGRRAKEAVRRLDWTALAPGYVEVYERCGG